MILWVLYWQSNLFLINEIKKKSKIKKNLFFSFFSIYFRNDCLNILELAYNNYSLDGIESLLKGLY
jgi:hypothetical protein